MKWDPHIWGDLERTWPGKTFRNHSDDHERESVQVDGLSYRVRVGPQRVRPKAVTDDRRHLRRCDSVLLGEKPATRCGAHSQHIEVVVGHEHALGGLPGIRMPDRQSNGMPPSHEAIERA